MIYKANGYIYGVSNKPIDEESKRVYEIISTKPQAQEGYDYRLKDDLTWELFKIPESLEATDNEATEADYINALEDLGVNFNG